MKKVYFLIPVLLLAFCCCPAATKWVNFNIPIITASNFSINRITKLFSLSTDYFRSKQVGNWADVNTWESSADNISWFAATLTPTDVANTIQIRNTHTVTVSTSQTMDQVMVENGGILLHTANTLTVNDGAGDDIMVLNGGIFTLASNSNGPVFSPATATAIINTGGMLRLSATGLTNAGTGVHANNYIYQHASVLEYTPSLAFSSAGVTFFPNADAVTIPIFRTTNNLGLIGAGSATVINGLFEANGTITFTNAGPKTFRNGIIGTGNIGTDVSSGKFIINGSTASLGGTGSLTLPTTGGMDIGAGTTVTMVSDKAVTGNIALLANALVILNSYNLTMTGNISGGSATSHIVTNGSGKLVINNIVGATPRIFPIGANTTTINPLAIFNGDGLNYGARVETGLNPPIGIPLQAVNRTWVVRPSGTPSGTVNVNFFYAAGDGNAGFNYFPATVELGLHTGVWNVINTGLTQFGSYQVTGTVNIFAANTDAPMVIANLGAILANNNSVSVNYFTGIKQNSDHILNWKLTCNSTPHVNIEIQRSNDGRNFNSIHHVYATALRCQQPFNYTDDQPAAGVNYYRIRMIDADGKNAYSNVIVLINAVKGFEIMPVAPNPVVNGNINLKVSAAQKTQMQMVITDLQGRVLQKQSVSLFAGFNTIVISTARLPRGTYGLAGYSEDMRARVLRFVIQ